MTRRQWASNFVDVLALWGVAIVQPMLSILGGNTEYFVRFGIPQRSIIGFTVAFVVVVPLILSGIGAALQTLPWLARAYHLTVVAVLGGCVAGQLVKFGLSREGVIYVLAVVAATAMGVLLWRRFEPLRQWMRFLAVVPFISAALFLLSTPAGRYARADTAMQTAGALTETPVVMVMFDEFPVSSLMDGTGSIDAVRFPHLARLAGMSTWYRQYTAESEVTSYAVPAALSGISPKTGLSATYVDHPRSVFSLFAESHEMNVYEVVTQLCDPTFCTEEDRRTSRDWRGFVRGLARLYRQRIDTTMTDEFNAVAGVEGTFAPEDPLTASGAAAPPPPELGTLIAVEQAERLRTWVGGIGGTSRPQFSYAHVILPHQPWVFLPTGESYGTDELESMPDETPWETRVFAQRHLLQVQYIDSLIGEMLARLEDTGLLDTAMIVVTADHGVALTNGYARRYASGDYRNAREIMGVPLFVKEPGKRVSRISDANVQTTDLLPILTGTLGLELGWESSGSMPTSDSLDRTSEKTLLFQVNRFDAANTEREDESHTLSAGDYADWLATVGSPGSADDVLSWLYADLDLARIRGQRPDTAVAASSSVRVVLDSDISGQKAPVLLRGEVRGAPADARGVAITDTSSRIIGVAPFERPGGARRFVTVVTAADGRPAQGMTYWLISGDGTLQRIID